MKYVFNIAMCCDPVYFKFGMILNTTKVYSLSPVWMMFVFTLHDRVMGKLELVQSFCCKVAWSNSDVYDGWLCKGDDCEQIL